MSKRISRRGALRILGTGLALPLGVLGLRALRGEVPAPVVWRGEVLGALSSMTLWHPKPAVARRAIGQMLVEIDRLENIFSLYRSESEIVRLNRDGALSAPSRDLVEVFDLSRRIADLSNGAFDPTIQPLWRLYESGGGVGSGVVSPDNRLRLDRALALVDQNAISMSARMIRFGKPGMAASLNGIAQGYITDRITEILTREGFENAMIELGETRALGTALDGQPFSVGLIDPAAPGTIARDLPLANASLSVSGGYGMQFDTSGRHHIFDPVTGQSANRLKQVAVVCPKAVVADALSTAIYVAGEEAAAPLLAAYPTARAILWRNDGSTREV